MIEDFSLWIYFYSERRRSEDMPFFLIYTKKWMKFGVITIWGLKDFHSYVNHESFKNKIKVCPLFNKYQSFWYFWQSPKRFFNRWNIRVFVVFLLNALNWTKGHQRFYERTINRNWNIDEVGLRSRSLSPISHGGWRHTNDIDLVNWQARNKGHHPPQLIFAVCKLYLWLDLSMWGYQEFRSQVDTGDPGDVWWNN